MKESVTQSTLNQIMDKRSRDHFKSSRYKKLNMKLNTIYQTLEILNKKEVSNSLPGIELTKYYPIVLMACIEDYLRYVIKDLINFGNPYTSNISKLKSIEINLEMLVDMGTKNINIGEIVSHVLPVSRFNHIQKYLTILISDDFFEELKKNIDKNSTKLNSSIANNHSDVISTIKKAIRLRHIFAHELGMSESIPMTEAIKMMACVSTFTYSLEETLNNELKSQIANNKKLAPR